MVYAPKMPRWVEPMPSPKRMSPKVFASHTLLLLCQIKFQHYNFFENEKWTKGYELQKWESTLNLCVHAHGHDVELIMEASWNNNNPLFDKFILYLCLVLCHRGPDQIVLLWSHFSDKLKYLSSADLFFCPTPIRFYLRVLPSGISRISRNYITSYEFFMNY